MSIALWLLTADTIVGSLETAWIIYWGYPVLAGIVALIALWSLPSSGDDDEDL